MQSESNSSAPTMGLAASSRCCGASPSSSAVAGRMANRGIAAWTRLKIEHSIRSSNVEAELIRRSCLGNRISLAVADLWVSGLDISLSHAEHLGCEGELALYLKWRGARVVSLAFGVIDAQIRNACIGPPPFVITAISKAPSRAKT